MALLRCFCMSHERLFVQQVLHEFHPKDLNQAIPGRPSRPALHDRPHSAPKGATAPALRGDLCGHEKYLKTTIFGLVGQCPDAWMRGMGGSLRFVFVHQGALRHSLEIFPAFSTQPYDLCCY